MRRKHWVRVIDAHMEASYFVRNKATIRQTAKNFGVSKSQVYLDITKYLDPVKDSALIAQVQQQLKENKQLATLRGGAAFAEKCRKFGHPGRREK